MSDEEKKESLNSSEENANLQNPEETLEAAKTNPEEAISNPPELPGPNPLEQDPEIKSEEDLMSEAMGKADGITTPADFPNEPDPLEPEVSAAPETENPSADPLVVENRKLRREVNKLKSELKLNDKANPRVKELEKQLEQSQKNNRKLAAENAELKKPDRDSQSE